jgi:hypothetical protein
LLSVSYHEAISAGPQVAVVQEGLPHAMDRRSEETRDIDSIEGRMKAGGAGVFRSAHGNPKGHRRVIGVIGGGENADRVAILRVKGHAAKKEYGEEKGRKAGEHERSNRGTRGMVTHME